MKANSTVYYEVEAIYYKKGDKVPIGTRLLAYSDSKSPKDWDNWKNYDKKFHVFIPNISQAWWSKSVDRGTYRKFIKNYKVQPLENKISSLHKRKIFN